MRRIMVALALGLLAVAGWWVTAGPPPTSPERLAPDPVLPAPRVAQVPLALSPRPQVIPVDLARAVAAAGAELDGRPSALEALPATVHALLDHARLLLAATPRRAAPGLPMRLRDGMVMRLTDDSPPARGDDANDMPADSPAGRERARAVDGELIARTLALGATKTPPAARGERVKEILEPDAWIAVPYDPALVQGLPLELTNRSLGEYVLRLDADDFGSVRLNGGLAVPGRYYRLDGTMTISSDVPVGVVIRPLGVVHGYYDQPVRPPSANG